MNFFRTEATLLENTRAFLLSISAKINKNPKISKKTLIFEKCDFSPVYRKKFIRKNGVSPWFPEKK
jgi:hypothetical protein